MNDKILDGILLLDQKKCPECNAPLTFWSMPDYDDNNELRGRIRRWWHLTKDTDCNRMWCHV